MCSAYLKTGLAIGFSAVFQSLTLALLVTYLIFTIEIDRIWDQMLETQIICVVSATFSTFLSIFPLTALCLNTLELLKSFRESIDRDVITSDSD